MTEWRVLASLADGARETIGTLSQLTLTKQPTLSKIVQRMERQGLVMRGNMASDRRQTLVALTRKDRKWPGGTCGARSATRRRFCSPSTRRKRSG